MVSVTISSHPIARVPSEFLSVALDAGQFFPGHFWEDNVSFPFRSQRMGVLARALAPARLRVGGTEADKLWYDVRGCFNATRCDGSAAKFLEAVPRVVLERLFEFARLAGFGVVFGLNAGPAARSTSGQWDPNNSAELVKFAAEKYPDVSGWWELGNEPEAFPIFQHTIVRARTLAKDLLTLRSLLDRVAPTHKIAGIDSFGNPPFVGPEGPSLLPSVLQQPGSSALDAITYHWYPLIGDGLCKHLPSWACHLTPGFATLERAVTDAFNATETKLAYMNRQIRRFFDSDKGQRPLWLGEGSLAAGGGRDGVTNRFASSLFFLFELGQAAISGHSMVFRQALAGGAYSLIDIHTLSPLPDYWAALLYKRLMGTQVHQVNITGGNLLRAFAHCHPSKQGLVSVMLVNPTANAQTVALREALPLSAKALQDATMEVYLLTAGSTASPLSSAVARVNGRPMSMMDDLVIPEFPVMKVAVAAEQILKPFSAGFFLLDFSPCAHASTHYVSGSSVLV